MSVLAVNKAVQQAVPDNDGQCTGMNSLMERLQVIEQLNHASLEPINNWKPSKKEGEGYSERERESKIEIDLESRHVTEVIG